MYTIEEATLSRHNPTYHIPTAAARDCDREGIIRALEQENQHQEKRSGWLLAVHTSWQKVFETLSRRPKSASATIPAEPKAIS
jgi:hypothetical protein